MLESYSVVALSGGLAFSVGVMTCDSWSDSAVKHCIGMATDMIRRAR